jgi:hypothetical protein
MLTEKNILLKEELNRLINFHASNKNIKKIIEEEFKSRNYDGSKGSLLFLKNKKISDLSNEKAEDNKVLFIFTKGMYNALVKLGIGESLEKINIVNFFTEVEISEFNKPLIKEEKLNKDIFTLKNAFKIDDNHYSCIITSQQLKDWDDTGEIDYNFESQREARVNTFGLKEIKADLKKIAEIEQSLIDGTQYSDEIIINVLRPKKNQNFPSKLVFNSRDGIYGELQIVEGKKDIVDGYHRKTANSRAIINGSNPNFLWKLTITNLFIEDARAFMEQKNKQKPMKLEHQINLKDTASNDIVDFIKSYKKRSNFASYIADSMEEIKRCKDKFFVKKSTLSIAIEECFKTDEIEDLTEKGEIADWITKVIDFIIKLNKNYFIDYNENNIISNNKMFLGYVKIAAETYKHENWEEEVKLILDNIKFDNISLWKNLSFLSTKDANKTLRDKLYSMFSLN